MRQPPPKTTQRAASPFLPLAAEYFEYAVDAAERTILFWDVMRQRANQYHEHAAKTVPHVLDFQVELVVDGRKLERPVNYGLVRIVPPEGSVPDPRRRPFVVVLGTDVTTLAGRPCVDCTPLAASGAAPGAPLALALGALAQAVRTLRRTLGDNSRESKFIRTVSRHGYQFVYAGVVEEPDNEPVPAAAIQSAPVENGFDALAKIADHQPDLVFVDIMMPRLDGYQTCALIKKNGKFQHTPVIMLSSKDSLFDRARGRMVGSDEYLTKPFTKESLLRAVESHLAQRSPA